MHIDPDAFVAYYRNRNLPQNAQQAWSANIASAWQRLGAFRASLLELACRLQVPLPEPACALSPAA